MPDLVPLPGSERRALPNVQPAGAIDPNEQVSVTLLLRRRAEVPSELITGPQTLSPDELAARYGADPADVELVTSTLEGLGLTVSDVHLGQRLLTVTGTVAALAPAFRTPLTPAGPTHPHRSPPVPHTSPPRAHSHPPT